MSIEAMKLALIAARKMHLPDDIRSMSAAEAHVRSILSV